MARKAKNKIIEGLKSMLVHAKCAHRWQSLPRRKRLYGKFRVGRYCSRCRVTEYSLGNVNS